MPEDIFDTIFDECFQKCQSKFSFLTTVPAELLMECIQDCMKTDYGLEDEDEYEESCYDETFQMKQKS